MNRFWKTTCGLLLFAASTGCASFRGAWRGFHNDDLTGRTAPALTGTGWIRPASAEVDAAAYARRWRLIVFFLPQ